MASSKSASQPLALELLMSDHRKVEALFVRYEREKEREQETRRGIAQRICTELSAHAQLEEELFYPWLRENLDDMEMVEEAQVEHNTAKDLIAQIVGSGEIDDAYDARVKVLSEYIKHHVKEEEQEIFPEVRDKKDELDELGQEMAARKGEIAEQIGLEEEPGETQEARSRPRAGRGRTAARP